MNQACTKDEYFEKLKNIQPFTEKTLHDGKQWLEKLKKEQCIFPPLFGVKTENVSGNHIYESKNCYQCFDTKKSEDSKYLYTAHGENNCYDISFTGALARFCHDCLTIGNTENLIFSHGVSQSSNLAYCELCYSSHDLFGCNGLRNAQYCILNKQYSKEEYFKLREKIIEHMKQTGEWGEFFPIELSPFAYNEAIVNEYFPLSKEQVLANGWQWKEEECSTRYEGPRIKIPDTIAEVSDDICTQILTCEATGKNYRIQKEELKFYRKMNLPIPGICPDERHKQRMALRNKRTLHARKCDTCGIDIQTTFTLERPEKVFCEKCYLDAIN
jgi:hypothetical protein